ncbi:alpha/beta hydrolase [Gracilimonas sp. BCB1]|uniref:alpha/beta hydrolase n=1 Tax=Gracilimonas sp. BCB1 TaxID=3152362 RepID=UPI003F875C87
MGCSTPASTDRNEQPGTSWDKKFRLSNGMIIEVFIPEDYDPDTPYPLLLLNDGEDMFGGGSWNMDRVLQDLISDQKIRPVVAAAIYNQGQRMNWYIPYDDRWITTNWGPYTPDASEYAQGIFDYVIPYMDENYSIDTTEVAILGASLGGLISTWMGLTFPDKIKYSAGLSGSLWVADYSIFSEVEGSYDSEQKFWFDIGTNEWNYYVPLYRELDQHGVTPGQNNFYYEVPSGAHIQSDWLQRIHLPLAAFFSPMKNPEPESMEVVLECIPSQSTRGLYFRRLNPIVTLSNGVKYSLAHTATYSVVNGEAELGTEGGFKNNPQTEVQILVEHRTLSETVQVPMGWCP